MELILSTLRLAFACSCELNRMLIFARATVPLMPSCDESIDTYLIANCSYEGDVEWVYIRVVRGCLNVAEARVSKRKLNDMSVLVSKELSEIVQIRLELLAARSIHIQITIIKGTQNRSAMEEAIVKMMFRNQLNPQLSRFLKGAEDSVVKAFSWVQVAPIGNNALGSGGVDCCGWRIWVLNALNVRANFHRCSSALILRRSCSY
ncbi:hypothetical protein Tco_0615796 [Tanacetum coccineum]